MYFLNGLESELEGKIGEVLRFEIGGRIGTSCSTPFWSLGLMAETSTSKLLPEKGPVGSVFEVMKGFVLRRGTVLGGGGGGGCLREPMPAVDDPIWALEDEEEGAASEGVEKVDLPGSMILIVEALGGIGGLEDEFVLLGKVENREAEANGDFPSRSSSTAPSSSSSPRTWRSWNFLNLFFGEVGEVKPGKIAPGNCDLISLNASTALSLPDLEGFWRIEAFFASSFNLWASLFLAANAADAFPASMFLLSLVEETVVSPSLPPLSWAATMSRSRSEGFLECKPREFALGEVQLVEPGEFENILPLESDRSLWCGEAGLKEELVFDLDLSWDGNGGDCAWIEAEDLCRVGERLALWPSKWSWKKSHRQREGRAKSQSLCSHAWHWLYSYSQVVGWNAGKRRKREGRE